jgi:hypothetical protein
MARRRLLTLLASIVVSGALALPAVALPGLTSPLEPVEELAEDTIADIVATDATTAATVSTDDGPLPTGEGEPLEPLAPVLDPVLDLLEPVIEPAEEVVDAVEDVIAPDDGADPAPAPGKDEGTAPLAPSGSSSAAGADVTPAPATDAGPAASAPLASGFRLGGPQRFGGVNATPQDAANSPTPNVAVVEPPSVLEVAPPAEAITALDPIGGDASTGGLLKAFAAVLIAGTAAAWHRKGNRAASVTGRVWTAR